MQYPEKYRPDIDGIRALAIVEVILFHLFPGYVPGGFIGVDIFFIISGYLITKIILSDLNKNNFEIIKFYVRRINRIIPSLLIVIIIVALIGIIIMLPQEYELLLKNIAAGASFTANLVLINDVGYFNPASEQNPLLHLWSLGVEEQFYLIWPLIIYLGFVYRINLAYLLLIILVASISVNIAIVETSPTVAFYALHTRAWELAIGGLCALVSTSEPLKIWLNRKVVRNAVCTLGLLLIIIANIVVTKNQLYPGWWALLPAIGTSFLIIAGPLAYLNKYILANRVCVWLGLISFALYLWHWVIISFVTISIGAFPTREMRVVILFTSVIAAALSYYLIELPIKRNKSNSRLAGFLLAGAIVLAGLATFAQNAGVTDWLNSRQSHLLRAPVYNWEHFLRIDKCYLQDVQLDTHDPICSNAKKINIGLWGDSYAASLYPGLAAMADASSEQTIIQYTQAGCLPLLDYDQAYYRKNCQSLNRRILSKLQEIQPQTLILHGAWLNPRESADQELLIGHLSTTIQRVKQALPQTEIVLIGPVPQWLQSAQYDTNRQHLSRLTDRPAILTASVPNYDRLAIVDSQLHKLAQTLKVQYISPIEVLCEQKECISRVGEGDTDWLSIDTGHLSRSGSIFFIDKVWPVLGRTFK